MATILTAHQPLYIPWLGFFNKVAMSDVFCLWDDVQFITKDYIQRNRIKNDKGEFWLSVPILTEGYREKTIKDMHIDNTQNWRRIHWNSLFFNYKKAPYFESYIGFFKEVYEKNWETIADLDEYLLKHLLKELGISVTFIKASEHKFEGTKSDRVLDMCIKLNADAYVFGAMGKDYANAADFEKNRIVLHFQNYKHPNYTQLYGEFVPNLSIVDLLFNHGEKSYGILMKDNPTREDLAKILKL